MKKALHLALALAVTASVTGCYGPFKLTKKIHKWNGEVGEKWVNEAVFLGFVILPVYAGASLLDALVFNSIEFWGGDNPIASRKGIRMVEDGEREAVLSVIPSEQRVRVDQFAGGRPVDTVTFENTDEGTVARDAKGELLMRARTRDDGGVQVLDRYGKTVAEFTPEEVVQLKQRAG